MELKSKTRTYNLEPIGSMCRETWAKIYSGCVNDSEVKQFLYQGTIPTSIEHCKKLYDTLTNEKNVVFNIFCPGLANVHVGIVGIFDIYWPSRVGEFRILIGDKHHWGDGVGYFGLELMNDIVFERLGLHKFWLGFNANHKRAEGAYTKAGFQRECVIKRHHYKNGVYNDIVRLCMFQEDYKKWKESKLAS